MKRPGLISCCTRKNLKTSWPLKLVCVYLPALRLVRLVQRDQKDQVDPAKNNNKSKTISPLPEFYMSNSGIIRSSVPLSVLSGL